MPCHLQLQPRSFPYKRCLPENYGPPLSTLAEGKSFPLISLVNLTSMRSARTENRHMEDYAYMGRVQTRETCTDEL